MNYLSPIHNFTFAILLLFATSCNGQATTVQPNKTVAEQLSFTSKKTKLIKNQGTIEHQNMHCSLQDKNGNLWFGATGEGVYKNDEKEFTQFTDKDGLSSNKVWSILEDKTGYIWIGTTHGVCMYFVRYVKRDHANNNRY